MRQRLITFAIFGIVLVALGEWGMRQGRFAALDSFWLEFCVGNAGDRIRHPAVTVIRIDDGYEPLRIGGDENTADDGRLSRLDFATILGFVGKLNPKSVAFLPTPTFDESLVLNQTDIVPLKDAAMQLPKFLVATTVSNDGEQAKEEKVLDYPSVKLEGDPVALLAFSRTVRYPDPQILENGIPAFTAIESARNLADKSTVRIPLVSRRGDQIVPSLVLAAAANHAGVPLDAITVHLSGPKPKIAIGEAYTIPIESDGTMVVPSHGGITQTMTSFSRDEDGKLREVHHFTGLTAEELAYTGEEEDEVAKRILASFQGKFESLKENLVVIGFDRTADRRIATAAGETLSETSLLARAIATIQSGRFIHLWPGWARGVAVLVIVFVAAALFRLPRRKFLPLAAVSLLAFFAAKVMVFSSTLSWTPPFVALSLFALMLVVGMIVPGGKAERKEV